MNTTKKLTLAMVGLLVALTAKSQTFMDHLRQNRNGKAGVVVTQSKEIDDLVNGNGKTLPGAKGAAATVAPANGAWQTAAEREAAEKAEAARREAEARRLAENKAREAAKTDADTRNDEATTVDMRKKVMRGSRKVTGYRVQAFAGGNTRNDKQRAQQIGNAIKMKFPDQPVYVHFYSPRWICRVGNFRSYQEAQAVLKRVRAMGYGSATIVKGQITVQY